MYFPWRKTLINLFAGGESVLKLDFNKIQGLKVFINWAFRHFDKEIDILIWGDDFVGDGLYKYFNGIKPCFKMICHRGNGGLAASKGGWIDDIFQYPDYNFTISWAILYLKEKFPNEDIIIYGLDGEERYADYYDGWNKGVPFHPSPPDIEKKDSIRRSYLNLDKLPDRDHLFVCEGSAYKGFPVYSELTIASK